MLLFNCLLTNNHENNSVDLDIQTWSRRPAKVQTALRLSVTSNIKHPSLGFKENGPKRENVPVSLEENASKSKQNSQCGRRFRLMTPLNRGEA